MSATVPNILLSNGVRMPALAIGTAPLSTSPSHSPRSHQGYVGFFPERVTRSVRLALDAGLRHVDTALLYRSHEQVAHVIRASLMEGELDREDFFLTSKVLHPPAEAFGMDDTTIDMDEMTPEEVGRTVHRHVQVTLRELGVGYLDLMLLHWPSPGGGVGGQAEGDGDGEDGAGARTGMAEIDPARRAKRIAAWRVLEHYYSMGWLRAIGTSNFHEVHLQHLMDDGARVRPHVNQIETSVYIRHDGIVRYCRENGIAVSAFSPFGRGIMGMEEDGVLVSIASKHGATPGQVALAYLLHQGFAVTFYSGKLERMRGNIEACDIDLDESDVDKLEGLQRSASWGLPSPYTLS
ncbi:hypothetical protein THAOC_35282 [Thalassiosira oceanica]|uniref:NADP-dependent oxidoreductase domain-containing protein n=1 Tax=Thalassiosira oceanica TaxID=159749 RepID=K0R159_THAOC|nr:hypothetical protein THAOC_35282 [Thalassiosira oceanica]|eukprot:EJK46073.1 hypothetical protein THAOC_35282 [Thalassiosira oceanica]